MKLNVVGVLPAYRDHLDPIRDGAIAAGWKVDVDDPDVTLCASTKDLRPGMVYMEHGVGLQWHRPHALEAIAQARKVLAPNEFISQRFLAAGIQSDIIGTPKLDALLNVPYRADGPVCISFHWTSVFRSNILRDYRPVIADLAARREVIGHAHPRVFRHLVHFWEGLGIEPVESFGEVVKRASTYVCDHSSTLYEWAALGRPVVMLDYPQQQSFPGESSGLRYEWFAGIGHHALPSTLVSRVEAHDTFAEARREATEALFPYLGSSVARTLEVLHG